MQTFKVVLISLAAWWACDYTGPATRCALATSRTDFDHDGDADGFDFLTFSNCYNGSNRPPLAPCANPQADLDADGDVDGFDFLTFSNCYNGSNRLPRCGPPEIRSASVGPEVVLTGSEPAVVIVTCKACDKDGTVESVTADLSALGGSSSQALRKNCGNWADGYWWEWRGEVAIASSGSNSVNIMITDNDGQTETSEHVVTVVTTAVQCFSGNGHCYAAIPGTINWPDAKAAAESLVYKGMHGHLATITSAEENAFVLGVRSSMSGVFCIGGSQPPETGEPLEGWQWITGEPWGYTNWHSADDSDGLQDYLVMQSEGKWEDDNDYNQSGYIVEFEPQVDVREYNEHWYAAIPGNIDWPSAKVAAESLVYKNMGGHLATITSADENAFVCGLRSGMSGVFCIGGSQPPETGEPLDGWQWITGEPWEYTNWHSADDSDGLQDYLVMQSEGKWEDDYDHDQSGYIVEFEPEPDVHYFSANGHYYAVIPGTINWPNAKVAAESLIYKGMNGHLATITSAEENAFVLGIRSSMSGVFCIGGSQPPETGEPLDGWQWITGEPWGYANWHSADDSDGLQDYLVMQSEGKWEDDYDHDQSGYIVEFEAAPGVELHYCAHTGHYYSAVPGTINWPDAKAKAESLAYDGMQGHLVSITSAEENAFVLSVRSSMSGVFCIGGFQPPETPEPADGWQWVTGEPWGYTNWHSADDWDGLQDYLVIQSEGKWEDDYDHDQSGYVVEYEP